MGPPCQALGAAEAVQGLACADCAVWVSASQDYREGSGPPGGSYLEAEVPAPALPTVICLCAQKPGRFHPKLPQEQTKTRAVCAHASPACAI